MDEINFTIIRYWILSQISFFRFIWDCQCCLFFLEVYEHFPAEAEWIAAYWCSINILSDQSSVCIGSENLLILTCKHIWHVYRIWSTLSSDISLSASVEWPCKSKVIGFIVCVNSFRTISNLYSTIVDWLNIRPLSSIWWLCSLRFIFEGVIDKWFHSCVVLVEFRNSFLLRNWVFEGADGVELAHSFLVQWINASKGLLSDGFLMICQE